MNPCSRSYHHAMIICLKRYPCFKLCIFLYGCIIVLIYGCNPGTSQDTFHRPQEEIVVGIPENQFPPSMHPTLMNPIEIWIPLHLTLTHPAEAGKQQPVLLQHLPNKEHEEISAYIFRLREDAKWDDGTPLTIEDVLFSAKILSCPVLSHPVFTEIFDHVIRIDTGFSDPYTFKVEMQPHYTNTILSDYWVVLSRNLYDSSEVIRKYKLDDMRQLDLLSTDSSFVQWAAEYTRVDTDSSWAVRNPGAGPYKIAKWVPGADLLLEKKVDYWMQDTTAHPMLRQSAEKIRFRKLDIIRDILNEEVDLATHIPPRNYEQLLIDSMQQVYEMNLLPGESFNFIAVNLKPNELTGNPVLLDVDVRNALEHFIPVKDMILSQYGDELYVDRIAIPVRPRTVKWDTMFNPVQYNPAEGLELLLKAGWKDENKNQILEKNIGNNLHEFSFSLVYDKSNAQHNMIATFMKKELQSHGIDCRPLPIGSHAFYSQVDDRFYDAVIMDKNFQKIEAELDQDWRSESWLQGGGNLSGFGSDETDRLIDIIIQSPESDLRQNEILHFWQKIEEEKAIIGLFAPRMGIAIHRRLANTEREIDTPIYPNSLRLKQ